MFDTCFWSLLVEGTTSGTAGRAFLVPCEKSPREESAPRLRTVRRRLWAVLGHTQGRVGLAKGPVSSPP